MLLLSGPQDASASKLVIQNKFISDDLSEMVAKAPQMNVLENKLRRISDIQPTIDTVTSGVNEVLKEPVVKPVKIPEFVPPPKPSCGNNCESNDIPTLARKAMGKLSSQGKDGISDLANKALKNMNGSNGGSNSGSSI